VVYTPRNFSINPLLHKFFGGKGLQAYAQQSAYPYKLFDGELWHKEKVLLSHFKSIIMSKKGFLQPNILNTFWEVYVRKFSTHMLGLLGFICACWAYDLFAYAEHTPTNCMCLLSTRLWFVCVCSAYEYKLYNVHCTCMQTIHIQFFYTS